MKLRIALTLMSAGCVFGQPDYFPLQVGNQWIYRNQYGVHQIEVTRTEVFGDKQYFFLQGAFGGDAWVRKSDDGTVVWQLDPATDTEKVRLKLDTPAGGSFETVIDPCNKQGIMVARDAHVRTPAAEFVEALEINYPAANCADAGLDTEYYAPWIGLVASSGMTIAGARRSDLIYARIGGVTVLAGKEFGFGVTLDKQVYEPGAELLARITLRTADPQRLTFASGQTFDLLVKTEAGESVLLWSEGKAFTMAIRTEVMEGERNWVATLPLKTRDGSAIAPGKYVAEVWLATLGPRTFVASTPFEVAKP